MFSPVSFLVSIFLVILNVTAATSVDVRAATASSSLINQSDIDVSRSKYTYASSPNFVGAVYAMTNDVTANSVVVYGRFNDGTVSLIDIVPTGGQGAILDSGDGVDPLISAGSIALSYYYGRPTFVLAANAGSDSITVFRIMRDFSLKRTSVTALPRTAGSRPISIAVSRNIVYVATEESRSNGGDDDDTARPGAITGFVLSFSGRLHAIRRSTRTLTARPGAVQFTPDGRTLISSQVFAGSAAFGSTTVDEILSFRLLRSGRLSKRPVDTATSTELNNSAGRNLPAAIGFKAFTRGGAQFVVVTEARGLTPAGLPTSPQTGSTSVWRVTKSGRFVAVSLDILTGSSFTEGQMAACWVAVSPIAGYFWVSNTGSDTLSSFRVTSKGKASLAIEVAAVGEGPVDVAISSDGKFLYQMFAGKVAVFEIEDGGMGPGLTSIQMPMNIPDENAQGIVAF